MSNAPTSTTAEKPDGQATAELSTRAAMVIAAAEGIQKHIGEWLVAYGDLLEMRAEGRDAPDAIARELRQELVKLGLIVAIADQQVSVALGP